MSSYNPATDGYEAPPNPSAPGTPQWHYDEVMRWIEPDLLSTVVPLHPEKYRLETAQQTADRMAHYDKAFAIFDQVTQKLQDEDHAQARAVSAEIRKQSLATEEKERGEDIAKVEKEMG
jgi:RPA family protein